MEFSFDINYVLPYEVTIFNGEYRVLNKRQSTRVFAPEKLTAIIDAMGMASFKAQGLFGAVTTAAKFRTSNHRLYIIKKANENNHLGIVIGILKVGEKHLYIYDSNGKVHERTPLCVLDFYVHESRQRLGYGKRLFDTMLEHEQCAPHELAIDRPSNKCLAFLRKHYSLSVPIHQVNNFVVYPAFFNQTPATHNQDSWTMMSDRQHRRPFSEQLEMYRNERAPTLPKEDSLFGRYQPPAPTRGFSLRDERMPLSPYTTSYNEHYNQTANQTMLYTPRVYSQAFNGNKLLASSQQHSNSAITYRNFQSPSTDDFRRNAESNSHSIYTFPSMMKSTNHLRHQPSTIDSTSPIWKLFNVQ